MYNIRIKSLPPYVRKGDQVDYSLYTGYPLYKNPNGYPKDDDVKTTETGVERDEATIEAEGGEVRLTSTPDGYVKLMTILGKSHAQGGEPIKAKPGDFIFSKTKSLAIKDPEVLSMFGIGGEKPKSYTPADLAKRYQLNAYVDTLKDPLADAYSKNTAQLMLDNHMKKLGGLALVQESMKGFPDGIPAVAESVLAGLQAQQQGQQNSDILQGQPMEAKYGGTQLQVYQKAGPYPKKTNTNPPKKTIKKGPPKKGEAGYKAPDGYTGYWDRAGSEFWSRPSMKGQADPRMNQAARKLNPFSDEYTGKGAVEGTVDYIGNLFSMPQKEVNHLLTGLYETPMTTVSRYHKMSPTARIVGDIATDPLIIDGLVTGAIKKVAPYAAKGAVAAGKGAVKTGKYVGKKVAPYVEKVAPYAKKAWNAIPNKTKVIVAGRLSQASSHITNYPQEPEDVAKLSAQAQAAKQTREDVQNEKIMDAGIPVPVTSATPETAIPTATYVPEKQVIESYNPSKGKPAPKEGVIYVPATNSVEVENPHLRQQKADERAAAKQAKIDIAKNTRVVKTPVQAAPVEEELPFEISTQKYGGVQYGELDRYQGGGGTPPTRVRRRFNATTGKNEIIMSDGSIVDEQPGITYDVKDQGLREAGEKAGYEILYPASKHDINYIPEQTRKTGFKVGADSGFYENEQFKIGAQGLQDYMDLWDDELQRYSGPSGYGPDAWKKDLMAQKGDEGPASKFIVNAANALSYAATGKPQVDVTQKAAYKPGIDVFNLKKFKKKSGDIPPPPEKKPPLRRPPVTPPVAQNDWWLQDRINFAGIMGDRVNKYGPTMGHYRSNIPDYALEDPAMLNQLAMSAANTAQSNLYNTTAGNVAGAGAIGAWDSGLNKAAENQATVQNRNVNTYNQASLTGAQIANQENQLNEGARQKYATDSAIANQQYDNAMRNLKWQQIGALNQGITNFQTKNQLEDELYKGARIDPDTGNVYTDPYRQMWNEDGTLAYDPRDAYGTGAAGGFDPDAAYDAYIKKGMSHEQALGLAGLRLKAYGVNNTTAAKSKKGYGNQGLPGGYGFGAQAFNPYGDEETS